MEMKFIQGCEYLGRALRQAAGVDFEKKFGRKYMVRGNYHWRDYHRGEGILYRRHVDYVISFFKDKSGTLLDIGCGDGLILSLLNEIKTLNCFGIDISPLAIEFAYMNEIKNCMVADALRYGGSRFNFLFVGDILEHIKEPQILIERMKNWLLEDGTIFFSFPIQKKKERSDYHLFTGRSSRQLVENTFEINYFELRKDLKKMYIVAKQEREDV